MSDDDGPKFVTNKDLALEIRALRSDVKLWILGAVALNQFLASVDLPSAFTAAAVGAVAAKGVLSFLAAHLGGS